MSLMSRFALAPVTAARSFAVQRAGFASSAFMLAKKKIDTGYPQPPKAAPTAYSLFQSEWFAKKRDSSELGQKLSITSFAKEVADEWKSLSESDKQRYEAQRSDAKKAYDAAYQEWYESLDADALEEIASITGRTPSYPGGKAAWKKVLQEKDAAAGVPPKPITAFFEYTNEFRKSSEAKGMAATEVASAAGAKWKQMNDDQKKKWTDIAAAKKKAYKDWQGE